MGGCRSGNLISWNLNRTICNNLEICELKLEKVPRIFRKGFKNFQEFQGLKQYQEFLRNF